MHCGRVTPAGGRNEVVDRAVQHQRRRRELLQTFRARRRGNDRRHLPQRSLRIIRTVVVGADPALRGSLRRREMPSRHMRVRPFNVCAMIDALIRRRRLCRQRRLRLWRGARQRRIARRREDRDQRTRLGRMIERHQLRDHAAHRAAHDMRAFDAEFVEKPGRVCRQIVERVRDVRLLARGDRRRDVPRLRQDAVPFLREADVAIVEADDAQARIRQRLAETPRASSSSANRNP